MFLLQLTLSRTPFKVLSNQTPYFALFQQQPSYSHLKVFGCLCYASTLPKTMNKFSPRAISAVFLGYPTGYKGYKLLDFKTNTVFISRDVVLHENIFPYKEQSYNVLSNSSVFTDVFTDFVLLTQLSSTTVDADSGPISHEVVQVPSDTTIVEPISFTSTVNGQQVSSTSRYPQREHVKPRYLIEFHCYSTISSPSSSSVQYPLSQVLSYHKVSTSQRAMSAELEALENNGSWTVVSLPAGKRPVACKWIYKLKFQADGTLKGTRPGLLLKDLPNRRESIIQRHFLLLLSWLQLKFSLL